MKKILAIFSLMLCSTFAANAFQGAINDQGLQGSWNNNSNIYAADVSGGFDGQFQGGQPVGQAFGQPEGINSGDQGAPCEEATGECYCLIKKYIPETYCTTRCEYEPCYSYKRCCRYVPQYYQVQCCRYVPQYYCKTACRYVAEPYYTCQCTYKPKYCTDTHVRYRPVTYWKHTCGNNVNLSQEAPAISAPISAPSGGCASGRCGR